MSERRQVDLFGELPRARPQRRSGRRPARERSSAPASASRARAPASASRTVVGEAPPARKATAPARPLRPDPAVGPTPGALTTALSATAELAEIAVSLAGRALRGALARLLRL